MNMSRRRPLEERFWDHVSKGNDDECWTWTGAHERRGYGKISEDFDADIGQVMLNAHRVSWELQNGPIPKGKSVLHRCDNPSCVNPSHLFLGTSKDNVHDMMKKGRAYHQTHPEQLRENSRRAMKELFSSPSREQARNRLLGGARRYRAEHPEKVRGENIPSHKLTERQVLEIRRLRYQGLTLSQLGKMFGIDQSGVSLIVNRKRWTYLAEREQPADDKPSKKAQKGNDK